MDHVRKQIDFGPRPPDTPQLAKTRAYIVNELKSYGLNVSLDEFSATTPQGEKKMANIVGEIPGETKTLILITSHYDTKFYKDMQFRRRERSGGVSCNTARDWTSAWQYQRKTKGYVPAGISLTAKKLFVKVGLNVATKRILITLTEAATTFRNCARATNSRIPER
jgi:hypothetical protein